MTSLIEKRTNFSNKAKIAIAVAAALIVSPVIFMVIQGIVGLAIAAALGLVIVNAAPIMSMKLANWKIKEIVSEAKQNPIETLENLIIAKEQALKEFVKEVESAVAARNVFETKCNQFVKMYPARAKEFDTQLDAINIAVEQKKKALNMAKESINNAKEKLKECKAYYEMSIAVQNANAAMKMDTGDIYEQLKADTAIDSVMAHVSKTFGELEVAASMGTQGDNLQLSNSPSPTLEISTANIKNTVKL